MERKSIRCVLILIIIPQAEFIKHKIFSYFFVFHLKPPPPPSSLLLPPLLFLYIIPLLYIQINTIFIQSSVKLYCIVYLCNVCVFVSVLSWKNSTNNNDNDNFFRTRKKQEEKVAEVEKLMWTEQMKTHRRNMKHKKMVRIEVSTVRFLFPFSHFIQYFASFFPGSAHTFYIMFSLLLFSNS